MRTLKTSIVIPVYKVEKENDTLLHQIFQDIKIVIFDVGSPYKWKRICDENYDIFLIIKKLYMYMSYIYKFSINGIGRKVR